MFENIKNNRISQRLKIDEMLKNADANADGYLNVEEVKNIFAAQSVNISDDELSKLIEAHDKDGNELVGNKELYKIIKNINIDHKPDLSPKEFEIVQNKIADKLKVEEIKEQHKILKDSSVSKEEKDAVKFQLEIIHLERKQIITKNTEIRQDIHIDVINQKISENKAKLEYTDNTESENKNITGKIEKLQEKLTVLEKKQAVTSAEVVLNEANINLCKKSAEYGLTEPFTPDVEKDVPLETGQKAELSGLLTESKKAEVLLDKAENELELHQTGQKIEKKTEQLEKPYIPEFHKETVKKDIEKLEVEKDSLQLKIKWNEESAEILDKVKELHELRRTNPANKEAIAEARKELSVSRKQARIDYYTALIQQLQNRAANHPSSGKRFQQRIDHLTQKIDELKALLTNIEGETV